MDKKAEISPGGLKSMESQRVGHNGTSEHQALSKYWMNG